MNTEGTQAILKHNINTRQGGKYKSLHTQGKLINRTGKRCELFNHGNQPVAGKLE